jgi:hypothetical protein
MTSIHHSDDNSNPKSSKMILGPSRPIFFCVFLSGIGFALFALLLSDYIRAAHKAPATPLESGNITQKT